MLEINIYLEIWDFRRFSMNAFPLLFTKPKLVCTNLLYKFPSIILSSEKEDSMTMPSNRMSKFNLVSKGKDMAHKCLVLLNPKHHVVLLYKKIHLEIKLSDYKFTLIANIYF